MNITSGKPIEAFAPMYPNRVLTGNPDDMTTIESMKEALKNPAFEQKWGKVLRAKHPQLKAAHANTTASNALNGKTPAASSRAADSAVVTGELNVPKANVPKFHQTANLKTRQVKTADGWMPRGMEATPMDKTGLDLNRGQEGDPLVAAGLISSAEGQRGARSAPGLDSLLPKLGKALDALIHRLNPSVKRGDVTVKGIRAQDAATEKSRLLAAMDAAADMEKQTGLYTPVRTVWDKGLRQYVLA
ncbi:hypothetical protein AWB78_05329 [Caballeronia calidae]|uniref:Uncharacterized protein n=1 Tax=Caballeronia calidae TaxID=1777139 RepID=A0A158DNK1_9BURK|nr:hypothetical protein [Caballeronia calidae]SAK95337.1 hypothetical protein AWB78_05329 [Caballeronia calidae]